MQEILVQSLDQEDPLEEKMAPAPGVLPGESQGQGAWWAAVYGVAQSRT